MVGNVWWGRPEGIGQVAWELWRDSRLGEYQNHLQDILNVYEKE